MVGAAEQGIRSVQHMTRPRYHRLLCMQRPHWHKYLRCTSKCGVCPRWRQSYRSKSHSCRHRRRHYCRCHYHRGHHHYPIRRHHPVPGQVSMEFQSD